MGKLILVPTPIGNLEDITLRALKVLEESDLILSEDTRKTKFLLKHFNIDNKTLAYHKFNEHNIKENIIKQIEFGKTIALVSDAGTPGISDPGFLITRECLLNNIEVECLPGATAFLPALINSGLPCDKFVFEGFLPRKKGRNKRLNTLSSEERTIVIYESPHRLLKTLQDLSSHVGGERQVSVSKELTKIHETTIRGTLNEIINKINNITIKGEFVIVVAGKT